MKMLAIHSSRAGGATSRLQPADTVLAWADGLDPQEVAITAMNEAEILQGITRLPNSQRRQQLQQRSGSLPW